VRKGRGQGEVRPKMESTAQIIETLMLDMEFRFNMAGYQKLFTCNGMT
jgi:hypothetical protein